MVVFTERFFVEPKTVLLWHTYNDVYILDIGMKFRNIKTFWNQPFYTKPLDLTALLYSTNLKLRCNKPLAERKIHKTQVASGPAGQDIVKSCTSGQWETLICFGTVLSLFTDKCLTQKLKGAVGERSPDPRGRQWNWKEEEGNNEPGRFLK